LLNVYDIIDLKNHDSGFFDSLFFYKGANCKTPTDYMA